MKKAGELALGLVTSIGGFLEIGSLSTSAQAGAAFHYQLAWAILLGTIGLGVLMEGAGRLAAVSRRTFADQLRERFGVRFFSVPLLAVLIVSFLVLASEIGGVSLALQLVTHTEARWWALPVAFVAWLLLWRHSFTLVEQGTAGLGLITVIFGVAAVATHPEWGHVTRGLLPSMPRHEPAHYWYLAVSILGAAISPYLFIFYSSGVIEDKWTADDVGLNRVVAVLGNLFGGLLAICVLIVAARVFAPHVTSVDQPEQLPLLLSTPFGRTGFILFVLTLGITCFGATVEIALTIAYSLAQGFGWQWSENEEPGCNARFASAYSLALLLGGGLMATGIGVLTLTNISMMITAASLPLTVVPLLVLLNDRQVMNHQSNGWVANASLGAFAILSVVLLLAALPLQLMGGG
ncbi:MAG: natural resistance-associated macrophage protein [Gemmatimonadetes bacterium]|nr:natural resistance-associated macrophage protein [Gemmatimonadota bacterium]